MRLPGEPVYCPVHQHYEWCSHDGGVMGETGYEAPGLISGDAAESLSSAAAESRGGDAPADVTAPAERHSGGCRVTVTAEHLALLMAEELSAKEKP